MRYRMETIRMLALQMCKRKKQCWTSKRYSSSFFRKPTNTWGFYPVDSKSIDQTSSDSSYTTMLVGRKRGLICTCFFFTSNVFRLKVLYHFSWSKKKKQGAIQIKVSKNVDIDRDEKNLQDDRSRHVNVSIVNYLTKINTRTWWTLFSVK